MKNITLFRSLILTINLSMIISFLIFIQDLFAQNEIKLFSWKEYRLESPIYDGNLMREGESKMVYEHIIKVENAPWMRLYFRDVFLGKNSYLVISSVKNDSKQKQTAATLKQWNNSSAYFNGDELKIELYVSGGNQDIFFKLEKILVGEYAQIYSTIEKICGATDDREPSDDNAVGRVVCLDPAQSIGTAFIIDNGALVTAGHCFAEPNFDVLEFNVPYSLDDGTIQFANPDDQYAIDQNSKVGHDNGVGDDWGVFRVFNNSGTQLQPIEAQQAYYIMVQDSTPENFVVTGYGADGPAPFYGSNPPYNRYNYTQQSSSGPDDGSYGTILKYLIDTQGGNSGSPVIDESTGRAVGVHTYGGCKESSGNNQGTSTMNADFWEAIYPTKNVTIDQKLEDEITSIGTVGYWENNSFSDYEVPYQIDLRIGYISTFRGTQVIVSNQKYNHWNENLEGIINHHEFEIYETTSSLTSFLKKTQGNIVIKNDLSGITGGTIDFKDPWLIDYPDPLYGNNKRNRGMSAPFKSRPSPFNPDYTTPYNGDVYQGVFLNQDYGDPGVPYYSVRAPQTQVIPFHGQDITWYFQGWKGEDVQFQHPQNTTTAVVFQRANALVRANYKSHLVSNRRAATAAKNNWRIISDPNSLFLWQAVYKDDGQIYYTNFEENSNDWSDVRSI